MKITKADVIRGRIKGYMDMYGKSPDEMAIRMRICRRSWFYKMKNPERLTVEELERLERITGLELLAGGKETA